MLEPILELLPIGKTFLERLINKYNIHKTAYISRGVRIIYNDKRRKGQLTMKE